MGDRGSGDTIQHVSGLPRANLPMFMQMASQIGMEAAADFDQRQQDEMMMAFYAEPRLIQSVITRGPVVNWLRNSRADLRNPSVIFFSADGNATPFICDTSLQSSLSFCSEMYRRENEAGVGMYPVPNSFKLDRLVVVFDHGKKPVGSVAYTETDKFPNDIPRLVGHTEALRSMQAPLLRQRSDEQLSRLYEIADRTVGPGTEYAEKTGNPATLERFLSIEHGFGILELLDIYSGQQEVLDAIYDIARHPVGETLLQVCESAQEIRTLQNLMKSDPHTALHIAESFLTIEQEATSWDTEKILPYEKPVHHALYRIGRSLTRAALADGLSTDESKELYIQSSAALYESLNELFHVPAGEQDPVVRAEHEWHEQLTQFAEKSGSQAQTNGLIEPIVERYFLLKLRRTIPGGMKADREHFYGHIMADLNDHSEATGDDALQRKLEDDTVKELVRLGYWKTGGRYVDHNCGDGIRILRWLLTEGAMKDYPPGTVVGIDGMQFPQPEDGLWQFIQSDVTDPAYLDKLAETTQMGSAAESQDFGTNMWSGFNDNNPIEQEIMLILASYTLKKRMGDQPGGVYFLEVPMGAYIDQMINIAVSEGLREMGKAALHYPTATGTLDKELEILLVHDMQQKLADAGLSLLNIGDHPEVNVPLHYTTTSGVPRMVYVAERVRDPVLSLALATIVQTYPETPEHERLITESQYRFLTGMLERSPQTWVGSSRTE